jgi:predicted ATPase
MLTTIAEVQAVFGLVEAALDNLEGALSMSKDLGIAWYDAEIMRLQGRCLHLQGATSVETVEEHYQRALDIARRQRAKAFELRAALDLACLWRDQKKSNQARDLLAPIYSWFTEGFDAPVLKESKAALEQLASDSAL